MASIFINPSRTRPGYDKKVTLNCDQGVPRKGLRQWVNAGQRPGGDSWPPANFAAVQVVVPEAGTRLNIGTGQCAGLPKEWFCQHLRRNQPGIEYRDWINGYYGQARYVNVVAEKPSIRVVVSRAYNYNHNQVEQKLMIADQKPLVKALTKYDTPLGFSTITSTAGCCTGWAY